MIAAKSFIGILDKRADFTYEADGRFATVARPENIGSWNLYLPLKGTRVWQGIKFRDSTKAEGVDIISLTQHVRPPYKLASVMIYACGGVNPQFRIGSENAPKFDSWLDHVSDDGFLAGGDGDFRMWDFMVRVDKFGRRSDVGTLLPGSANARPKP